MAKAPPAKNSAKGAKQPAPNILSALANTEPSALTPMNFRVPEEFHREFKLYAVQHGISMVDLLQESFRVLKEKRGH